MAGMCGMASQSSLALIGNSLATYGKFQPRPRDGDGWGWGRQARVGTQRPQTSELVMRLDSYLRSIDWHGHAG